MALSFSVWDSSILYQYIRAVRGGAMKQTRQRLEKDLLKRYQEKGIPLDSLADIETDVWPNSLQLKFTNAYLTKRVMGAFELQDHLQPRASLQHCYKAIDQLVVDEFEGPYGAEHTKAEEIIDSARSYMHNPRQRPQSFENRADTIPGIDAFCGGFMVGTLESFFAYETTASGPYAALAFVTGAVGGMALTVYIDSWVNYDLISSIRKLTGKDPKDAPTLLEERLDRKRRRYEKLCQYAQGI